MQILFLSRWFPFPPNNGSKLRISSLLRGLQADHDITLLTFAENAESDSAASQQHGLGQDIHVVRWKPFDPCGVRARFTYFSGKPRSVIDTFSTEMAGELRGMLASRRFDLVIASQIDMAVYSPFFRHLPAVLEEVELSVLYERFARATSWRRRLRHGLTWIKHRRYLASALRNFRMCTVVSKKEKDLLLHTVARNQRVEIIPNGINVQNYDEVTPHKQPSTLIFTGALTFEPNYEAMFWFTQQVLPKVRAKVPDTQLIITGEPGGRPLPNVPGITRTGYVDDIRPLVAAATVSVAPIHSGGGTRLKVLEAMALRTPVVATSKGAEGLDVEAGQHLVIADSADEFAEAVVQLMRSPERQQHLADHAYRLVRERYDTGVIMPAFLDLVAELAAA